MTTPLTIGSMNWDDVKIFTAVGETGSFSAAAKLLNMDHSSISRRMRQLEKAHNTTLFERDGPRVSLADDAEALLKTARQATGIINQFERKLKANDEALTGRIGFSTLYASEGRLMASLNAFTQRFPNIELDINFGQTLADLNNNKTDVVLRVTNHPAEHYIGKHVATNHFAVFGNKALYSLDDDLSQLPWVLWSSRFTDHWMAEHMPSARCAARINTAEGMLTAIANGIGIGHISHLAAARDDRLIELYPASPQHDLDFWLLYHQDLRGNQKITTFVEHLYRDLKLAWSS